MAEPKTDATPEATEKQAASKAEPAEKKPAEKPAPKAGKAAAADKPETPKTDKPKLVAVDGEKKSAPTATVGRATPAAAPQAAREEKKSSSWAVWLLLVLLLGAGIAALVQTQRLEAQTARATALSEQVLGLEAQLSAANTQIATFEMQRGQIRTAVSDLFERVVLLGEMVAGDQGLSEPSETP